MRKVSTLSNLIAVVQLATKPISQDKTGSFYTHLRPLTNIANFISEAKICDEPKVGEITQDVSMGPHLDSGEGHPNQGFQVEEVQFASERDLADMESMFVQEGIPSEHFARMLKDKRMTVARLNGVYQLVEFYKEMGASCQDCLRAVARRPKVADLPIKDKVESDVRLLQNLGVTSKGVGKILTRMPEILLMPRGGIKQKLDYFASLELTDSEVAQIISKNGSLLMSSLERNIHLKVEYFRSLGLTQMEVGLVFLRMPQVARLSVEKQIKPNILLFETAGASSENIKHMVKNFPRLLALSLRDHLDVKLWFAQEVMNKSMTQIFLYLPFFTLSLDNRILFRAAFLRRKRKEFKNKSLKMTFGISVEKFNNLYGESQVDRFAIEWELLSRNDRIVDACGIPWYPKS